MAIQIGALETITSGEESVRGFRVTGNIQGFSYGGRGGGSRFSVIDDDGLVVLTAVYNVFASDNTLERNRNSEIVIDNDSLRYMRQAVDQGLVYMDALPEEGRSPDRRAAYEKLKTALARITTNRIPAGFLNENLGGILRRTSKVPDGDSQEQEPAFYRSVFERGGASSLGQPQQICVNSPTGLRCGPARADRGLGAGFCTRGFDSGEVIPTPACPQGVRYSFGSGASEPTSINGSSSSEVNEE
jgi:hypothetical protein